MRVIFCVLKSYYQLTAIEGAFGVWYSNISRCENLITAMRAIHRDQFKDKK